MSEDTRVERRRTGALIPLSRDEVALDEAKAHALGLQSLVSLADGTNDDDTPFPYEHGYEQSLEELAYAEYEDFMTEQENDAWQ